VIDPVERRRGHGDKPDYAGLLTFRVRLQAFCKHRASAEMSLCSA